MKPTRYNKANQTSPKKESMFKNYDFINLSNNGKPRLLILNKIILSIMMFAFIANFATCAAPTVHQIVSHRGSDQEKWASLHYFYDEKFAQPFMAAVESDRFGLYKYNPDDLHYDFLSRTHSYSNIDPFGNILCVEGFVCIGGTRQLFRFNIKEDSNFIAQYPGSVDVNFNGYSRLKAIYNKQFALAGASTLFGITSLRILQRLDLTTTTDISFFDINGILQDFEPVPQLAPDSRLSLMLTLSKTADAVPVFKREVFDWTQNGTEASRVAPTVSYIPQYNDISLTLDPTGAERSVICADNKLVQVFQNAFTAYEDPEFQFVATTIGEYIWYTIWIPSSDFVMIGGNGENFEIFNARQVSEVGNRYKITFESTAGFPQIDSFQAIPRQKYFSFYDHGTGTADDVEHIYHFPEIGCADPLAATCGDHYVDDSLTCKKNAKLSKYHGTFNQCRCYTGFYYDVETRTCLKCNTCKYCDGPRIDQCFHFFIPRPYGQQYYGLAKIDTIDSDINGYRGIISFQKNRGQTYEVDFDNGTVQTRMTLELNLETDAGDMDTIVNVNSNGILTILGKKIRMSSVNPLDERNQDDEYSGYQADGSYNIFATRPEIPYLYTALTSSDTALNNLILILNKADSSIAIDTISTAAPVRSMHLQYGTNFLITSPATDQVFREIFDVTMPNAAPLTHTKRLEDIDYDITGPDNEKQIYVVIYPPRYVEAVHSNTGVVTRTSNLNGFIVEQPLSKIRRAFPLGNTDYVIITSNWHKFVIWNYMTSDFETEYYDTGYNRIEQIVIFNEERHIAVTTSELIRFFHIPQLPCVDKLSKSCSTTNASFALDCKLNASLVTNIVNGEGQQSCLCNKVTGYEYSPDTENCMLAPVTNSCFDNMAIECSGPNEGESTKCIDTAKLIAGTCRCRLGYFYTDNPGATSWEFCVQCPSEGKKFTFLEEVFNFFRSLQRVRSN